ncbi:quinone-dependent dihydroorotate dehydrogenase [Patescibacteria group bacterium]|nr:quinone-dependent dihydroorotate dehydrogenase [Patescibacteria group bacterium]
MQEQIINARNWLIQKKYKWIFKPIFFKFDPEIIHDQMSSFLNFFGKHTSTRKIAYWCFGYSNSILEQNILGINFKNPIGLAAGFDKNALLIDIMPSIGFGFMEIGSITAKPYEGNTRPRLYRLPEIKSLRVNYGLKNFGAEILHQQLQNKTFSSPVGINIAKTNSLETSEINKGIADYFFTYKTFQDIGSYFTINISCPNTCEKNPIFSEPQNLILLLSKIFSITKTKPVFIKLSPDLLDTKLQQILTICQKYPIDGFVCGNLTKENSLDHAGEGGFSGKIVQELSDQLIKKVYQYYDGKKIIIGCGGIFSAEDAYKKIKLGASLLQLITGMVFEGPQLISDINLGLAKLLKADGYKNISEAVGKEN